MTSKEALEKLSYIPIYEEDIDIVFKGDLCEVYRSEVDIISKDLDRLEKLEKENQKLKEIIKDNFDCYKESKKVFFTYTEPVMEKEILEVLENDK